MRVHAGTSGFSYDEWRGRFYPADLPASDRLGHYSTRLSSVEINNTFYQMPKAALIERWRDQVPAGFRFALKAPRRITHLKRLKDVGDSLGIFTEAAGLLGEKLGPLLFQLPPHARKDAPLLADFLALLAPTLKPAFEFRHASWFDDEIYALLSSRNAALCGGDSDEGDRSPPFVATADFGYLRLRARSYEPQSLRVWSERILSERWSDAYVYLKHEVLGPDYALFLRAVARGQPEPALAPPEVALAAPKVKLARPYAKKAAATTANTATTATSATSAKPRSKKTKRS